MSPAFLAGIDLLKQMEALSDYDAGLFAALAEARTARDELPHGPQRSAVNAVLDRIDVAVSKLSQPAAAVPVGGGYAAWAAFHAGHISEWLTLDQLRAECGRLATVGASSPELLLSHAMRLLDAPAAAVPDGWVLVQRSLLQRVLDEAWSTEDVVRDIAACEQVHALLAAAPQAPQQAERPTRDDLIAALQFYARGEHFALSDDTAWDTVSGEPQNWWCDEAGTATVEDGSIAKLVLSGEWTAEHVSAISDTPAPPATPVA